MRLIEAEWQIMKALWVEHPATARQVVDWLPKGVRWAHTMGKTMLARLADRTLRCSGAEAKNHREKMKV